MLQNVEKHYATDVDYWTYSLSICYSRYNETVPNYIAKLLREAESHVNTLFCNRKVPISNIRNLAIFKLACDKNCIYGEAAMWALHYFVH